MIFGYFDRRSHKTSRYGTRSQGLYRSGVDGTSGSNSQVAPSYSDSRMRRYTENLNRITRTFCVGSGGATLIGRMDDVLSFYKARQTGNPRLVSDKWLFSYLGMYQDGIADWTRARIREGWPVIVGTKTSIVTGFHYPVVTKYRRRTRRYRNCTRVIIKIYGPWKTEYDFDMFLHQGWKNLDHNKLYSMKSFFSIAAKY